VFVDKLFLAAAGVSLESGLTYPGLSDLPVKRAMIRAAGTVYLLADSSKIGRKSFATLGNLSAVHVLITDAGIDAGSRRDFESFGIEVLVASG
jgi:DeoR/GlpR family transcriptional regulator of sugar metabolism